MISVTVDGVEARFDDAGVDPAHPGRILGALSTGSFYEADLLAHVRSLGPLPGAYLDLGASLGNHTVHFALLCGAETVHAFEPRPDVLARLRSNVALNGLQDRVVLHAEALSDRTGRLLLPGDEHEVEVVTGRLDRLVAGPVALIKVDVDGMEPQALRGAAGILRRHRPRLFVTAQRAPDYEQVVRLLGRHGYRPTGRAFGRTRVYEFVPGRALPVAARLALTGVRAALPAPVRRRAGRALRAAVGRRRGGAR